MYIKKLHLYYFSRFSILLSTIFIVKYFITIFFLILVVVHISSFCIIFYMKRLYMHVLFVNIFQCHYLYCKIFHYTFLATFSCSSYFFFLYHIFFLVSYIHGGVGITNNVDPEISYLGCYFHNQENCQTSFAYKIYQNQRILINPGPCYVVMMPFSTNGLGYI